jgi:hypothetical protein
VENIGKPIMGINIRRFISTRVEILDASERMPLQRFISTRVENIITLRYVFMPETVHLHARGDMQPEQSGNTLAAVHPTRVENMPTLPCVHREEFISTRVENISTSCHDFLPLGSSPRAWRTF